MPKVSIPTHCFTCNQEEGTVNTLGGLKILLVVLLSMLGEVVNWCTWSPLAG